MTVNTAATTVNHYRPPTPLSAELVMDLTAALLPIYLLILRYSVHEDSCNGMLVLWLLIRYYEPLNYTCSWSCSGNGDTSICSAQLISILSSPPS